MENESNKVNDKLVNPLFNMDVCQMFEIERQPIDWDNYTPPQHGSFNCQGDYIWPTGEKTLRENIFNENEQ